MISLMKHFGFSLLLSTPFALQASQDLAKEVMIANSLTLAAQELSQSDLSCQSDNDCTVLPTGDKPCGGPTDYLLVSLKNPHLKAIQKLTQMGQEKEREINRKTGAISDCMLVMPPRTACLKQQCVTR